MRLTDVSDTALTMTNIGEPGLQMDEGEHLDSVALLACSIGSCTWATLATYGQRVDAPADGMQIAASWTLSDGPKRVSSIKLDVRWPELPESRLDAATRAARHCTIHATLSHGCEVDTFVDH